MDPKQPDAIMRKMRFAPALLVVVLAACSGSQPDTAWLEPARKITDPESGNVYLREQVFVASGPHEIASVFMRPDSPAVVPAFVVVSGSQDGILTAESPLHRRMLDNGFAVLVFGKKGAGASSGDWRDETFEDRARNVAAAIDWLEGRADVDAARVILFGHSQGGYVIPLLSPDPRVVGFVLSAASAEPVRDQIRTDQFEAYLREGLAEAEAGKKADSDQAWLDALLSGCGLWAYHYLCNIYDFEPRPHLESLDKPVLALFGENDPMVPPSRNLEPMTRYLAGNKHARVVLLPEANHMFWRSRTGATQEYAELVGPPAKFARFNADDPDHVRLAGLGANRVVYAESYLDAVEGFAIQHANGAGPDQHAD